MKKAVDEKLKDRLLSKKVTLATKISIEKRANLVEEYPNWEEWREYAREVKLHTLSHLERYIEEFTKKSIENGAHLYFASKAQDALNYVLSILDKKEIPFVIKSKSMVTEEINLNERLLKEGIEPIETDLGELIVQLAEEKPSNITAPAIHKSIYDIALLFKEKKIIKYLPENLKRLEHNLTSEEKQKEGEFLTLSARDYLRPKFLNALAGISGANFLIAETGTIVLVENEGNIRLTTSLPKIHIAIVGIEKIIPKMKDMSTFIRLLVTSATGQRQSSYVSLISSPINEELHIILLDNGRSDLLADKSHFDILSCIRCGSCMNICPVYRNIGGHAYGGVYPGPLGLILLPHLLGIEWGREIPFASSLCGACSEICPVKIPIHKHILEHRERIVKNNLTPFLERVIFELWEWGMSDIKHYKLLQNLYNIGNKLYKYFPPISTWEEDRKFPDIKKETFKKWWHSRNSKTFSS